MIRWIVLLALGGVGLLSAAEVEFDAASIKPTTSAGGSRGESPGGGFLRFAPGRVTSGSSGVTVRRIILDAYHLTRFQLSGGPGWIDSDRFTLEAKAADTSANETQLRLMLQGLLSHRFGLVVSHGTTETQVYALVMAKNGPGPLLQEMKDGVNLTKAQQDQLRAAGDAYGKQKNIFVGTAQTTQVLAERFSAVQMVDQKSVDRPVLDKTGLKGLYYWSVGWNDDEDFMTMAQEELGLKLVPEKAPTDAVVIEHVERPSEN